MADKKVSDYFKSWSNEKDRAIKFGKLIYLENCEKEIERILKAYPELIDVKTKYENKE